MRLQYKHLLQRSFQVHIAFLRKVNLQCQVYSYCQRSYRRMASESETYTLTKEGSAEVYLPTNVFYNPVQEFNRDLTIAVISQHARDTFAKKAEKKAKNEGAESADTENVEETKDINAELKSGQCYEDGIRILEGLAASGLRSVRFAQEIPGVREIVANDFDIKAVELIGKNVEHNKVQDLVKASHGDAAMYMYQNKNPQDRFDVIDLDPYGTPVPFLDAAVQAVHNGGLLCVTCTDMAVLCGNAAETCHAKYGSFSLRTKFCHEMALRIVLRCIEAQANKYGRYIEPLISISVDFYVRVFLRVHTSPVKVKESVTKLSNIYACKGCGGFILQPLAILESGQKPGTSRYLPGSAISVGQQCPQCKCHHHLAGPIWTHPIHKPEFVSKVLEALNSAKDAERKPGTYQRIVGMLSVIREELVDVPLYHVADELCKVLHCTPPTILQLRSAILHAGYRVSYSHCEKNSIKTNAPAHVIWDIMRCWVKTNPVSQKRLKEDNPARILLQTEPKLEANFSLHPDANPTSRKQGLVRWQNNPERDWGPKPRAKDGQMDSVEERRKKGAEKAEYKRKQQQQKGPEGQKRSKTQEDTKPKDEMKIEEDMESC